MNDDRFAGAPTLAPFFREDLFTAVRREMGRLFGQVLAPLEARSFAADESSWPSLDVHVTAQAFLVDAEIPGLEPGDIELSLRDGVLTITGEKRRELRDEKFSCAHGERFYGRFRRTLRFATEIDVDNVVASFKSGVLTVWLPRTPKPEGAERRITIVSSEFVTAHFDEESALDGAVGDLLAPTRTPSLPAQSVPSKHLEMTSDSGQDG